jgi:hypothetical protein
MMRGGRPGLVGTMARTAVVAGTATAVSGGVARRQQGKAEQAQAVQEQQLAPEPASAAPPAPAAAPDMITQLKELAELKDQGILTEDEFSAQKAKILGS